MPAVGGRSAASARDAPPLGEQHAFREGRYLHSKYQQGLMFDVGVISQSLREITRAEGTKNSRALAHGSRAL
jgi:hypothetical protein